MVSGYNTYLSILLKYTVVLVCPVDTFYHWHVSVIRPCTYAHPFIGVTRVALGTLFRPPRTEALSLSFYIHHCDQHSEPRTIVTDC